MEPRPFHFMPISNQGGYHYMCLVCLHAFEHIEYNALIMYSLFASFSVNVDRSVLDLLDFEKRYAVAV